MKRKKKIKIAAIITVSVLCVAVAAVGIHLGYAKTTEDTKEYTVNTDENPLRVAVISDLQLPDSESKTTHQYESFEKTLTMLKNKGMDVLIIAGDFTDLATENAYGSYKEIYDKVMGDGEKPIPLYIMGNHDYWLAPFVDSWQVATPAKMQKRFTAFTGEYPYSHKIINGYHFICWSSSDGSYDKSYSDKEWIRNELDKAVAADPEKPIFVISHLNPSDTAYGSDEWGNADIADVLKDYKQVISISGHSHYSLIDERSIWQGNYTAFTTQSLDYIELESGKFNGSIPVDAYGNTLADKMPGCLYMEIENDKVTINRLEANTGKELKEPWIIQAPFGSEESLSSYTDARAESNKAPRLSILLKAAVSDIKDVNGNAQKMLSFKAGKDDDFVHSYKLKFLDSEKNTLEFDEVDYDGHIVRYDENGNTIRFGNENYESGSSKKISEVLYFSDFVLGLENMSETVQLRLPATLPDNAEYVAITAIDSWGLESNTVVRKLG
ncbi:MAG: metallophosphoesterase family protein [Acutalibacteraceae bacterium]